METEYIVNYEIFNEAGQAYRWGNICLSIAGEVSSVDFVEHIRERAVQETGCLPRLVRIVGVFKL